MFYIGFFIYKNELFAHSLILVSDVSELLRSLTKNERCERILQDGNKKLATMSDLLRSLTKN